MKKLLLFSLFAVILLSGCTNGDRFDFAGSGKDWQVFYVSTVFDEDSEDGKGVIKYVGKEPAPELIDYEVETVAGGGSGSDLSLTDGVVEFGKTSCDGCAVTKRDSTMKVKISWDGKTEEITLTHR